MLKDKAKIRVIDHILIRDLDTGEVLLNQRSNNQNLKEQKPKDKEE